MNIEKTKKADFFYQAGDVEGLYDLIKTDIENEDPQALYFYSRFSLSKWNESDEEYNKRRIKCLTQAANNGVLDSMYQLACCYLYGEGISINKLLAIEYLKKAAEKNHKSSKILLQQI